MVECVDATIKYPHPVDERAAPTQENEALNTRATAGFTSATAATGREGSSRRRYQNVIRAFLGEYFSNLAIERVK